MYQSNKFAFKVSTDRFISVYIKKNGTPKFCTLLIFVFLLGSYDWTFFNLFSTEYSDNGALGAFKYFVCIFLPFCEKGFVEKEKGQNIYDMIFNFFLNYHFNYKQSFSKNSEYLIIQSL